MEIKLKKEQKEFITNKVEELGSIESVTTFYNKDCLVDKWANALARKLFLKSIKLQRRTK